MRRNRLRLMDKPQTQTLVAKPPSQCTIHGAVQWRPANIEEIRYFFEKSDH
jgi:hypothetical protein